MGAVRYRQCFLEKQAPNGRLETVSYLPEKYAVVGKALKLKDVDTWTDGWVVKFTGPLETEEYVMGASRVYLNLASIENSFK